MFLGLSGKNKMAVLASDWLEYFRLLFWNRWTECNHRNSTGSKISTSSTKCVFWLIHPGLWLAKTFSTSPLKPLERIYWNLTGRKILTSSNKLVFFGLIWKTRWPPWSLIGWDISDFFSETTERNLTKLDRKQYLNVFDQVCGLWGLIAKSGWQPWPLICWNIFFFSSLGHSRQSQNSCHFYETYILCSLRLNKTYDKK